jgi:hypothetical protein
VILDEAGQQRGVPALVAAELRPVVEGAVERHDDALAAGQSRRAASDPAERRVDMPLPAGVPTRGEQGVEIGGSAEGSGDARHAYLIAYTTSMLCR